MIVFGISLFHLHCSPGLIEHSSNGIAVRVVLWVCCVFLRAVTTLFRLVSGESEEKEPLLFSPWIPADASSHQG